MFSAVDLAYYIKLDYKEKFNKDIDNITLHKALYFLFAYWGSFVEKGLQTNSELVSPYYKKYLFDDEIKAWVYGPVVTSVLEVMNEDVSQFSLECYEIKILNKYDDIVMHFILDVLKDCYDASAFKLQNLACQDKCWDSAFSMGEKNHDGVIDKEHIIREYLYKK